MSYPTIWKGNRNNDAAAVRKCQEILLENGFDIGPSGIDGDFGRGTDEAIDTFQASQNLGVDGIVGKGTWAALLAMDKPGDAPEAPTEQEKHDAAVSALLAKIPAGLDALRKEVLTRAIGDLKQKEVPNGSNVGPGINHLVQGYREYWQTGGSGGMAWCGMAVSTWIALGLGLNPNPKWGDWKIHPFSGKSGGGWFGGVTQIEEWSKKNGHWHAGCDASWPAGSLFTVSRQGSGSDAGSAKAGHVGMVVCDNGDGTVTTIEGNVSNRVDSYNRKKSALRGHLTWW